jgi:hypothetical protein
MFNEENADRVAQELLGIVHEFSSQNSGTLMFAVTALESLCCVMEQHTQEELMAVLPAVPPSAIAIWKKVVAPALRRELHRVTGGEHVASEEEFDELDFLRQAMPTGKYLH